MALGFEMNFHGDVYDHLFVNNNGNVTFNGTLGSYTPFDLTTATMPIIAPFFADVDTRAGDVVTYGSDTVGGRPAFGVNWLDVGYYVQHTDLTNAFQLVLIDRSDVFAGAFDIEFNYDRLDWETGDASGGSGGLGGTSARAGFSAGSGLSGTFEELANSGVDGALLDDNTTTGLIHNSLNSGVSGRYVFEVRSTPVLVADHTLILLHDSTLYTPPGWLFLNGRSLTGDPLTAEQLSYPAHGDLTVNANGSFQYVPDPGYLGTDSFAYRASDGTYDSDSATVTLTMWDTAPTADNGSYTLLHDRALSVNASLGVLSSAADANGDSLTAAVVGTGPDHGTLTLNPDGSFVYTPDEHYVGDDSFQFVADDGALNSDTATITLTILNTDPVGYDETYGVHAKTPC